jgi:hypothetical protein
MSPPRPPPRRNRQARVLPRRSARQDRAAAFAVANAGHRRPGRPCRIHNNLGRAHSLLGSCQEAQAHLQHSAPETALGRAGHRPAQPGRRPLQPSRGPHRPGRCRPDRQRSRRGPRRRAATLIRAAKASLMTVTKPAGSSCVGTHAGSQIWTVVAQAVSSARPVTSKPGRRIMPPLFLAARRNSGFLWSRGGIGQDWGHAEAFVVEQPTWVEHIADGGAQGRDRRAADMGAAPPGSAVTASGLAAGVQ